MDLINFTQTLDKEFKKDCIICEADRPWFGHFILETDERQLAYKIGDEKNFGLRIIDWRHPLSKGFYYTEPGDHFDMNKLQTTKFGEDRYASIAGEVLQQTRIVDKNRRIFQATIQTEDSNHVIEAKDGAFILLDDVSAYFSGVEGLPDIRSLLTKDQYELITASHLRPLIIQGSAGSGKTTVALYRASWLTYSDTSRQPVDPKNILIVMFNKALQSFVSDLLPPLGLESANLFTFHAWALNEVKKAYRGKIEICVDPFEGAKTAQDIKKQIGILRAIEAFVSEQTKRLSQWVAQKLEPYNAAKWIEDLTQSDQPIVQRLIRLRKKALVERNNAQGWEKDELEQIHLLFSKAITRMTLYKEELLKFFSDKNLLQKYLDHVSEDDIDTLIQYQTSLQGKDRTPRRPGPFVGFEDLALILYLIQLKNGGLADKDNDESVNLFDHLVIDEAQDFGALEMTVLLSSVRTRSGVTIVGDTNQKIIPEADFMGWDQLAERLGIEGATVSKLEVAHRSTKPIMDLACSIIKSSPSPGRKGSLPRMTVFSSEEEKIASIVKILKQLILTSDNQHTCIVCRHARDTRPFIEILRNELPDSQIRLGHNKLFEFTPGFTVTNMRQIKGLEFDNLLVLDPSKENYPNDNQGIKNLYTILTRAKEQLFMIGSEEPSRLLNDAIENGLLRFQDQSKVAPIEFTEDEDDPF